MKRRVYSWLMAVCMLVLAIAPAAVVTAEEDLYFPEIELEMGTGEETRGDGAEMAVITLVGYEAPVKKAENDEKSDAKKVEAPAIEG